MLARFDYWPVFRHELTENLGFHIAGLILSAVVLFVAVRHWKTNRLASGLVIASIVLLFSAYLVISFPGSIEMSLSDMYRRQGADRVGGRCAFFEAGGSTLGLAGIPAGLLNRRWNWRAKKTMEHYHGPALASGFARATASLPDLWQRLKGPEFELTGHR